MTFTQTMEHVAQGIEAAGAAVLVAGAVLAAVVASVAWQRSRALRQGYEVLREVFGGALLLSLEILVAADLIRTVAVTPTLDSVAVLGIIVLIRTFLSFSLEIEIEGTVPWRRALVSGAPLTRRAVAHGLAAPGDEPEADNG